MEVSASFIFNFDQMILQTVFSGTRHVSNFSNNVFKFFTSVSFKCTKLFHLFRCWAWKFQPHLQMEFLTDDPFQIWRFIPIIYKNILHWTVSSNINWFSFSFYNILLFILETVAIFSTWPPGLSAESPLHELNCQRKLLLQVFHLISHLAGRWASNDPFQHWFLKCSIPVYA